MLYEVITLQPPDEILDSMVKHAVEKDAHKYMLNAGYVDVREKVAAHHNKNSHVVLGSKNIIMTVGAAGGLNVALKARITSYNVCYTKLLRVIYL